MCCFSVFGIICRYHGNTHSATVPKCVLHIYTSKRTCVPSLIWKCFFPSIVGIICRYHGNTFSPILKKFLAHLHLKVSWHVNPISFELLVKCFVFQFLELYAVTMATHIPPLSQNVSCTATLQHEHVCQIWFEMHFPLNFWHMPLPWQHTFLHCQKVCFAQLHHTATMCAKFHFKDVPQLKWNPCNFLQTLHTVTLTHLKPKYAKKTIGLCACFSAMGQWRIWESDIQYKNYAIIGSRLW